MSLFPVKPIPIEVDGLQVGISRLEPVRERFADAITDSVAIGLQARWHEQAGVRRFAIDPAGGRWSVGGVVPESLIVEFLGDQLMRMEATIDAAEVRRVVRYFTGKLGEATQSDDEWFMWKDDPSMVILQCHEATATFDMVHLDVVHWAEDRAQAEQERRNSA